jgi:hypothetical protein
MSPRHTYQRVAESKGNDRTSYSLEAKAWYRRPSVRETPRAPPVLHTANWIDIPVVTRIPYVQPGNGSHIDASDERRYVSHMSQTPHRAHAG